MIIQWQASQNALIGNRLKIHYYSRSRKCLWLKGETSGHFQYLKSMSVDCDGDTLLLQIEQEGGISCHTGHATCFYTTLNYEKETIVEEAVGMQVAGDTRLEHQSGRGACRDRGFRLV